MQICWDVGRQDSCVQRKHGCGKSLFRDRASQYFSKSSFWESVEHAQYHELHQQKVVGNNQMVKSKRKKDEQSSANGTNQ